VVRESAMGALRAGGGGVRLAGKKPVERSVQEPEVPHEINDITCDKCFNCEFYVFVVEERF
jgi:hypothetical protein